MTKKKSSIYIKIFLSTLLLLTVATVVNSEETCTISMEDVQIPEKSKTSGVLMISEVTNLGSFDINLSWDPTIVDIDKINGGNFSLFHHIDHDNGFVVLTGYTIETVNGNAVIADILFEAVGSSGSSCSLMVTYCQLLTADPQPEEIDCSYDENLATITITGSQPDNNGNTNDPGGNNDDPTSDNNTAPIANISVSSTKENVNTVITFDASESFDSDGTIASYMWDFGDGETATGIQVDHVFTNPGIYQVLLTVTDNDGALDEDAVDIIISRGNNPPEKPKITGPASGSKGIEYEYSMVSTDVENDNISYIVNWGDGKTNSTNFVSSNYSSTLSHIWIQAGRYVIKVKVEDDNQSVSETTEYVVLIDAKELYYNNFYIGYVTDDNGNGTFDTFLNNENLLTEISPGNYLIDSNGDGIWDYTYNAETEVVAEYKDTNKEINDKTEYNTIIVIGVLIIIILGISIIYIFKGKFKK